MANEHVVDVEGAIAIPFTVANATGIEKGTLLKLSDPMTAAAISATRNVIAGVLRSEKIASDGNTKADVYVYAARVKATASGNITAGDALISDHTGNKLVSAATLNTVLTNQISGRISVGTSYETATDGETFFYELRPHFFS